MKKTVLITGAGGGIGRAAAEAFLDSGWEVIGVDKYEIRNPLNKIHYIKGDISEPDSVKNIFEEALKTTDTLDALVNNAAIQTCKSIVEMEADEWDSIMESNLRSIFLSVRNSLHFLRKPGGAIINVSSVHAVATSANISAYAATKGGVLALTRALAVELAYKGIRVNAVLPGAVDTQMLRAGLGRGHLQEGGIDEKLKELGQKTPLGRIGKPEEIAKSIIFLADNDQSSFITGEALVIDGGALAKLSTE
jgi:NAD(P)-dependent dehydrogenase (short-subunit alcohol dehydrogenase family)